MERKQLEGILPVADMTYRVVAEGRDPDKTRLNEVMTPAPNTVGPDCAAIEALRLMQDGGYRHLPVVDRGGVLGVVSRLAWTMKRICGSASDRRKSCPAFRTNGRRDR
jgi:CBS domain-containing protein